MSQTQKRNNYNLDQTSNSKEAGFNSFKGSDGQYYFHFNESEGFPFIFSEGYSSSDSRDKGIQSVIKNASEITRYKFLKSDDSKYYFTISAANRQEIARSKNFESEKERNVMRAFFLANLNLKNSSEKESENKETSSKMEEVKNRVLAQNKAEDLGNDKQNFVETFLRKSSLKSGDLNTGSTDFTEPLRQSFRIDIYPSHNGSPVNGKITYLLDNEVCSFSGIDYEILNQFIASKLSHSEPKNRDVKVSKDFEHQQSAVTSVADEQNLKLNKISQPLPETKTEQPTLKILEAPIGKPSLRKEDEITIVLTLNHAEVGLSKKNQMYQIKVFGHNFETRENFLVLDQKRELELKNGAIKLCFHSKDLKHGSYRLSAVATTENDSKSKNVWMGTTFSLIS